MAATDMSAPDDGGEEGGWGDDDDVVLEEGEGSHSYRNQNPYHVAFFSCTCTYIFVHFHGNPRCCFFFISET